MNSFELFEALTDMDDEMLLRAEADPPRRSRIPLGNFRRIAAACLAIALLLTTWVATGALAGENRVEWTRRVKPEYVVYRFRGALAPQTSIPAYEPAWIPEEYVPDRDYWTEFLEMPGYSGRDMTYGNPENRQDSIWFSYHYVGRGFQQTYGNLAEGTYEYQTVDINGIPGDLYLYLTEPKGGVLIWIDQRTSILYQISFYDDDPTIALRVAQSVTLVENTEPTE